MPRTATRYGLISLHYFRAFNVLAWMKKILTRHRDVARNLAQVVKIEPIFMGIDRRASRKTPGPGRNPR